MKTTTLTCNACRVNLELDETDPYATDPPKIGWFSVTVNELRPAAPRPSDGVTEMATALSDMMNEAEAPAKIRKAARKYVTAVTATAQSYESPPESLHRTADLCPKCGPKVLGKLLPQLTSGHSHRMVGGY